MSKTRNTRRLVFALALGALGGLSLPMAAEAQEPTPPRAVRGGDRVVEREAVRGRRDAVRRAQMGARVMRVRQARGQGMARARQSGVSATALLNARRRLELTPRQVMQLDSIERTQVAARRANAERMRTTMRAGRDTTQATAQARAERRRAMREMTTEQREAMRTAMRTAMRDSMEARREAMRPELERMRAADSTARAAAERVLTDAQRQELRVMQAEARGRAQGRREALRSRGGRRP